MSHPAWISLSGNAFKLIALLFAKYRPEKPNSFPVGSRRVAGMIGVSESVAAKAVNELIDTGHLRQERKGRNLGRVATREKIVSLTRYDTETSAGDPDFPIAVWRRRHSNAPEQ